MGNLTTLAGLHAKKVTAWGAGSVRARTVYVYIVNFYGQVNLSQRQDQNGKICRK